MTENNNHKNFLLKNALNNPKPNAEIVISMDQEEVETETEVLDVPKADDLDEVLFDTDLEHQTVGGVQEELDGLEELDESVISIEVPNTILDIPLDQLNEGLDYKRLEDKVSGISARMGKLQSAVESFNSTLSGIHETLPKTLVKEADERITKHLGEHIDETIKSNFGSLKEQLSQSVKILVAQGGIMNKCMTALCNYINLLMIKNKITEIQLAMAKGRTFNDASKKQLENKLKEAHAATKNLPLKGILQMASSLGDGTFNNPSPPTANGNG